jgi:hypothetical protein
LLQALVGNPDHQDRFFVLHDLDAGDAAAEIEAHERADRFAGIGRDAHHVGGEIGIAEQRVAAVHGRGRRLAFEFTEPVGLREKSAHRRIAIGEISRLKTGGKQQPQQRCADPAV